MANFFNILKIKSSQKQYKNLQPSFKSNEERIKEIIYSMRSEESRFKTNEAARYCVTIAKLDSTGKPLPFYMLTKHKGDDITNINDDNEAFDITQNSEELMLYLNQNINSENSKFFLNAAASILTNIQRISSGKVIIGYTSDIKLKDEFLNFEYSSDTSDTELDYAWNKVTPSSQDGILKKVLGEAYYKSLPLEARTTILAFNHPFKTIYWRIIKYQMTQSAPLNEKVFIAIKKFPELQQALRDGYLLDGLNLSSETQIAFILNTVRAGGNVEDLQTETDNGICWLDEESMKRKLGY